MQTQLYEIALTWQGAEMAEVAENRSQKPACFQEIILRLQNYWAAKGCAVLQPYDMEVGAGTFHPATTLRALGSRAWAAAYVQPSRRPTDGRYGENPNRLQHYYQYQVIIKPSPPDLQELYLGSLRAIGIDDALHDIRFVEDDWESPTLGAWGLGWEVWCDGMEVSQFTYFQQVGGHDCKPVSGELTYGLERLAMYVLGVDHVMDMPFNAPDAIIPLSYGDVFRQTEQEYSRWNFDQADTDTLLQHFKDAEAECQRILAAPATDSAGRSIIMAHPAYDQCIKASHLFNLLDARGVISVTERQAYIGRVRALAKMCADAFVQTAAGGGLMGRFLVVLLLASAALGGAGMWYLQVYGYYDTLPAQGSIALTHAGEDTPRDVAVTAFEGIDAISSPIRFRACFTLADMAEFAPYDGATPLNAPGWFDCFDAGAIATALDAGAAQAVTAHANITYGIDRVAAIFPDGRAYAWHQINPCGTAHFDGDPVPPGCPPPPSSEE